MDPVFCLDKLEILDDDHIISLIAIILKRSMLKLKKNPSNFLLKSLLNSKMDVQLPEIWRE